jgi:hypothetical protein
MNFLNTVTSELQAQAALKSIANAAAEKVWQEDYVKFCDKRAAFIIDCIGAGLDIDYPIEAQSYPTAIPESITVSTKVDAVGFTLRVTVVARNRATSNGFGRRYCYGASCQVDRPGSDKHTVLADPDAQSLHDALVETCKAALAEVL